MSRTRMTKSTKSTSPRQYKQSKEEQRNKDFSMLSQMYNSNFYNNPIWMNNLLKDISTLSKKYTRDQVVGWLENYRNHEQELMELGQFLLNSSQHFRRLADYFIEMLTFNYVLIPTDIDLTEKEMKSPAFKKSYNRVKQWCEKFNIVDEGKKIFRNIVEEDVVFYYKRENEDNITFQRLPSAWCKIVKRNANGLVYSFNFMYFWRLGINIKDYPPEFEKYMNEIEEGKRNDIYYQYWVTLDEEKAIAFKFNEETGIIKSPFLGLFLDVLEISEFKSLIKSRTVLDNFLLLTQRIPMNKDSGKKNDFTIELDYAKEFHDTIAKNMPQGVKLVTTPMEISAQKLDGGSSQSRQSIVGVGEEAFYSSGGVAPALFGSKDAKNVGILQSLKVDETWAMRFYRQFERWINFQLRLISGKYRFKIWFPDITYYNWKEKAETYLKFVQYGAVPPQLIACIFGMNPTHYNNLNILAKVEKLVKNMNLMQSANTQSGKDVEGRPTKDSEDLTESGANTRDTLSNENKNE